MSMRITKAYLLIPAINCARLKDDPFENSAKDYTGGSHEHESSCAKLYEESPELNSFATDDQNRCRQWVKYQKAAEWIYDPTACLLQGTQFISKVKEDFETELDYLDVDPDLTGVTRHLSIICDESRAWAALPPTEQSEYCATRYVAKPFISSFSDTYKCSHWFKLRLISDKIKENDPSICDTEIRPNLRESVASSKVSSPEDIDEVVKHLTTLCGAVKPLPADIHVHDTVESTDFADCERLWKLPLDSEERRIDWKKCERWQMVRTGADWIYRYNKKSCLFDGTEFRDKVKEAYELDSHYYSLRDIDIARDFNYLVEHVNHICVEMRAQLQEWSSMSETAKSDYCEQLYVKNSWTHKLNEIDMVKCEDWFLLRHRAIDWVRIHGEMCLDNPEAFSDAVKQQIDEDEFAKHLHAFCKAKREKAQAWTASWSQFSAADQFDFCKKVYADKAPYMLDDEEEFRCGASLKARRRVELDLKENKQLCKLSGDALTDALGEKHSPEEVRGMIEHVNDICRDLQNEMDAWKPLQDSEKSEYCGRMEKESHVKRDSIYVYMKCNDWLKYRKAAAWIYDEYSRVCLLDTEALATETAEIYNQRKNLWIFENVAENELPGVAQHIYMLCEPRRVKYEMWAEAWDQVSSADQYAHCNIRYHEKPNLSDLIEEDQFRCNRWYRIIKDALADMREKNIYSAYSHCVNHQLCSDGRYYPFNVSSTTLMRIPRITDIPSDATRYEEMSVSLIPRSDNVSYTMYYRANFPSAVSYTMTTVVDDAFQIIGGRPVLVPGIPLDSTQRSGNYWGTEDARAFINPAGSTMLIYNRRDDENWRRLYLFDTESGIEVRLSDMGEKTNKNWTPLLYKSSNELVLVYTMQPVRLIQCNVHSGDCHFIAIEDTHFFNKEVADLRGGTPFYHYRDNYYYSFARTRDPSDKICQGAYYRPVFTIIEFTKEDNKFTPVFISAPFDFFGLPQQAVDPNIEATNCAWRYMLPYSIVNNNETMRLTLNLRDNENVVVTFGNVTDNIEALIEAHKESASKIAFGIQSTIERKAVAKALVYDHLVSCVDGTEDFADVRGNVTADVLHEAVRLCKSMQILKLRSRADSDLEIEVTLKRKLRKATKLRKSS